MATNQDFLSVVLKLFRELERNGKNAITQIEKDDMLNHAFDIESNSISTIVNHISGNMISRWTDIFTTDGEKSNRNRPSEFDKNYKPKRDDLLKKWEKGWNVLFSTLTNLGSDELMSIIYIRKEPHSVLQAILRQLVHYSVHIGQIIFVSKQLSEDWETLSIPREKEVFDYKEI